jgi:hypothetical protein
VGWARSIAHAICVSTARFAIKILPSADAELKVRFAREAKMIAGLTHPHICTLYDVGHQDGIDYLVMEHLEGQTVPTRNSIGTGEVLILALFPPNTRSGRVQVADELGMCAGQLNRRRWFYCRSREVVFDGPGRDRRPLRRAAIRTCSGEMGMGL